MPGIKTLYTGPGGDRMMVSSDVLGIANAVSAGSPTDDWSGDPRMSVAFNHLTHRYEVWRDCEDGNTYIICTCAPADFNASLLRHLSSIDTWKRDVVGDVDRHNARLEAEREAYLAEVLAGAQDVLAFALPRSYVPGHHDIKGRYGVGSIQKFKPKGRP